MQKATIHLETLTCPSCVMKIENAAKAMEGIDKDSVQVMFNSSKLKFNFNDDKVKIKDIVDTITKLGYEVKKSQVKEL